MTSVLACFAASEESSLGRRFQEAPSRFRSAYQRDRDRVIHCAAFRRLEYKTQVFLNHEGDMYRTRLTHSIEVSQIGRTIARALQVNEDLTEAICLAHDLGHTPFGHAGQQSLNECMKNHGGFEHNLQSLRVVDVLEYKYPGHRGLNLTWETREGILKHCSLKNARKLGELGKRFIERTQPGVEAQIANIADEIAYNNHDVDDGMRSGLINLESLRECAIIEEHYCAIRQEWPDLDGKRLTHELVRRMINSLVTDLVDNTLLNISKAGFKSIADVRRADRVVVCLGAEMQEKHTRLKRFLRENLYNHDSVQKVAAHSRYVVAALFEFYVSNPKECPLSEYEENGEPVELAIKDYIAGMTDRFALQEYARISGKGDN